MSSAKPKGVMIAVAALLLQVSVNTLRNWDKQGKLRAKRAKSGYRYYDIKELVKFAEREHIKIRNMKNLPV